MSPNTESLEPAGGRDPRERAIGVLSIATFFIFFQAYMVAPLIPTISQSFKSSVEHTGLIVPAYLIPYGIATLVYGLLADRFGVRRVMLTSLFAFAILSALTATAQSVEEMVFWRAATGLGAGGVVPLALVLIGTWFPYGRRGRPLGWLFAAMAGGMAFGSTFGAVFEPLLGWRGLFLAIGAFGAAVLLLLLLSSRLLGGQKPPVSGRVGDLIHAYRSLLSTPRGQRTYGYVFVNSVFHSGVFTWLGVYLEQRYSLGPVGIGLAIVGYGVPGFLFGPMIGRQADRKGRNRLVPIGLGLGAIAAAVLVLPLPLAVTVVAITVLSLGYDMTQPLFAGIVTSLGGQRPGQAMGLNVFILFLGFGLGSLFFGYLLHQGNLEVTLGLFAVVELLAALAAIALFRSEKPNNSTLQKRPREKA
jgi:predicted MFS family arabinose efflux permease